MQAREGDRLLVHSRTLGQPDRSGIVKEVRAGHAETMYRVAWDDGEESMFMPSAGVAVVAQGQAEPDPHHISLECAVDVSITEQDDSCRATASLSTRRGTFSAAGEARRHPDDPDVPMIGEELAIARALSALADKLTGEASDAIADHESRPIHLISP